MARALLPATALASDLRIYAGHGFRSTIGGLHRFADAMGKLGIPVAPLELVDARFYHLDTCFCPLNSEVA